MSVQTNLCDPNDLIFVSKIVYVNYETEKTRLKQHVGSHSGGGYHLRTVSIRIIKQIK